MLPLTIALTYNDIMRISESSFVGKSFSVASYATMGGIKQRIDGYIKEYVEAYTDSFITEEIV